MGIDVMTKALSKSYSNLNHPECSDIDSALNMLFNKVFYVKPAITSFKMTPSSTTYEIGTTINGLQFNWEINKDILNQTLTDCDLIDASVRSAKYATPLSSNKTFTLNINDGENSASASKTISFLNKIHWGNSIEPDNYDSKFILELSNSKLTYQKNGEYSFNCANNEYAYFATPVSMGITSAWVNGFQAELEKVATISHTNASGYKSDYVISKFSNSGLGNFVATVK